MVELLLLLAVVVGALLVMVRGSRPGHGEGSRGARRWKAVRRYREPDAAGLLVLAVAGLAAASLTARPEVLLTAGIGVGVAVALGGRLGSTALGLLGAGAACSLALSWTTGTGGGGCSAAGLLSRATRLAELGLVGLVFAVLFLVGRHLPGNRRSTSLGAGGLGLFATVDVVGFLGEPLGMPVLVSGLPAVAVSVLAAGVFGLAAGWAPVLVPALLGAGVALAGAGGALLAPCGAAPVAAVTGAAVFTVAAWATSRLAPHRPA